MHRVCWSTNIPLTILTFRPIQTVSFNQNFGLPLESFPSIFISSTARILIPSFNVPEPFQPSPSHDHRYRFHPCFLQDILISPVFQQAHAIVHHTIIISVVAIRVSSLTDIGHVWQP